MITVEKQNESLIRVYSDPGIEQELCDFFTFQVPGYKFMPAYRAGLFDGKIRLYDIHRKTLFTGLLPYIEEFAIRNEYDIDYKSDINQETEIDKQTTKKFIEYLNPCSKGSPIQIRDYQVEAITESIKQNRILLLSPTASGKSLIIYSLIRYHLEHGRKCIIIVPTTSLVEQMYSDFEDYSSGNNWNVARNCQKLYSGFSKEFTSKVLITTWQSIYKQPANWFCQFDVAFGDEAHLFKAKSLTSVMNKMTSIKFRIGTTGTIDNKNVHRLILEGVFGKVYKVITTKELMDSNYVANLKIKCLLLKYDEEIRKANKNLNYQDEIKFIISNDKRNNFIKNLAINCEGNTLILFQLVQKHGKILYDLIKNKIKDNRNVYFVYGGTDVEAREEVRKLVETQNDAIILASFGVFSTGVNIPSIENIIFASPSKSKIRNLQSIGRGLRLKSGKSECMLFDIADDISWKSKKNHTFKHFIERMKIYSEEKFNFKIVEINLE